MGFLSHDYDPFTHVVNYRGSTDSLRRGTDVLDPKLSCPACRLSG